MRNLPLNVIDVFSGCGGAALGFSYAGFRIRAGVDINTAATETFKINFPDAVVTNTDVRLISGKKLMKELGLSGGQTILIGCPPCQGFSSARRKSEMKTDPRNTLIYEFVRLLEEIKPAAFVMENVPGLVRGVGKSIFSDVLCRLHKIGYGNNNFDVINTADYGIPQCRKRLVLVGLKNLTPKAKIPEPTHADPDKLPLLTTLNRWRTVEETIGNLPPIVAGKAHPGDPLHVSASLSDRNLERLKETPPDGGGRESWSDVLKLECHKTAKGYGDVYGRMRWGAPAPTITGGCVMISKGRFGHPAQNRAISLREAARLQTFPSGFAFKGNFSQIASQIGNAVPPLLAYVIAKNVLSLFSNKDKNYNNRVEESKILSFGNKSFYS